MPPKRSRRILHVRCNNAALLTQYKQYMQQYMGDHGKQVAIDAQSSGSENLEVTLAVDGVVQNQFEVSPEEVTTNAGMEHVLERTYNML
jgi:hypothetical protein